MATPSHDSAATSFSFVKINFPPLQLEAFQRSCQPLARLADVHIANLDLENHQPELRGAEREPEPEPEL